MTVEVPSKDTPPANFNRELYVTRQVGVRRYLPKILGRDVRLKLKIKLALLLCRLALELRHRLDVCAQRSSAGGIPRRFQKSLRSAYVKFGELP